MHRLRTALVATLTLAILLRSGEQRSRGDVHGGVHARLTCAGADRCSRSRLSRLGGQRHLHDHGRKVDGCRRADDASSVQVAQRPLRHRRSYLRRRRYGASHGLSEHRASDSCCRLHNYRGWRPSVLPVDGFPRLPWRRTVRCEGYCNGHTRPEFPIRLCR